MRAKLTKTFCLECVPRHPAKGEKFWDALGSGLLVRVTPRRADGTYGRYFAFHYRTRETAADGRPRQRRERLYTIGPVGRWTLAQARDEVAQLNAQVAAGGDPLAERRSATSQAREAKSIEELARLHMERHHGSSLEE